MADIKKLIKEEVNKQLSEIYKKHKKPQNYGGVNYYNPMYMRDNWYGD